MFTVCDRSVQAAAMFSFQPFDQREAVLDLLQPAGRRVQTVDDVPQREREVLELRLDVVSRIEMRCESRIDRSELADPLPDTAERGERRRVVVVELRVALAAKPLNGVGAAQQLPFGAQRFILARLQIRFLQLSELELDEVEARRSLAIVHPQSIELL